jgi:probable rRNA maturation factor
MSVRLTGRRGLPRVDRRLLRTRARRILRVLDHSAAELSVTLVDDSTMATLNARYREIECPTDVLSFSLVEGDHAERRGVLLGDVVVSLETAERQARRARRTLDDEVLGLLIHGTLHLLGYDHEAEADARRMRAAERRVLRLVRG